MDALAGVGFWRQQDVMNAVCYLIAGAGTTVAAVEALLRWRQHTKPLQRSVRSDNITNLLGNFIPYSQYHRPSQASYSCLKNFTGPIHLKTIQHEGAFHALGPVLAGSRFPLRANNRGYRKEWAGWTSRMDLYVRRCGLRALFMLRIGNGSSRTASGRIIPDMAVNVTA
jgi:hypothetical protein